MKLISKHEKVQILLNQYGNLCFLCNKPFHGEKPTIDHWIPLSANGSDEIYNLRLAHKKCNMLKGDIVPNEDGTIPERVKVPKSDAQRKIKKKIKASICHKCNNGRLLGQKDSCKDCGSSAGPKDAPHYLKRKSKDCNHSTFWCWACSMGIVERRGAWMELMIGE